MPRSDSGTAGFLRLKPFTWASYSTVSRHGTRGGRSFPQSNASSITTAFGLKAASSRGSRTGAGATAVARKDEGVGTGGTERIDGVCAYTGPLGSNVPAKARA